MLRINRYFSTLDYISQGTEGCGVNCRVHYGMIMKECQVDKIVVKWWVKTTILHRLAGGSAS